MALKKLITLSTGQQAEYWRIKHYTHDHSLRCIEGVLEPYINQDIREDGKESIQGQRIPFRFSPEKIYEDVEEEFDTGKVDEDDNPIMDTKMVPQETGEEVWNFSEEILSEEGNTLIKQVYKEIKRTKEQFLDSEDC